MYTVGKKISYKVLHKTKVIYLEKLVSKKKNTRMYPASHITMAVALGKSLGAVKGINRAWRIFIEKNWKRVLRGYGLSHL